MSGGSGTQAGQVEDVHAACVGQASIEGHELSAVAAGEPEQIAIRNLACALCLAQFDHGCRGQGIRPEGVAGARDTKLEEGVGRRVRRTAANGQLGAYPDDAKLRQRASCPALVPCGRHHPAPSLAMMLVSRDQQGHEHVHVEKGRHYERSLCNSRLTSVLVKTGASGGMRNTGETIPDFDVGLYSIPGGCARRAPRRVDRPQPPRRPVWPPDCPRW